MVSVRPLNLADPERLGDRQWPVDEIRLRRDHRNGDPSLGERAQGKRGLERGHATAGDQNTHRTCASLRRIFSWHFATAAT
jgi:hypothetical protein